MQLTVFRVVQEALTNARKHGGTVPAHTYASPTVTTRRWWTYGTTEQGSRGAPDPRLKLRIRPDRHA